MKIPEIIHKKLKQLPLAPGCYLMRDATGRIIYIGKAASLRKRVQSYFRQATLKTATPKIRSLVHSIADFDVIVLHSEAEAILTEGRLIKEYRPYYNTLWKDDKRFSMITLDVQHPLPRITRCRLKKQDGAIYFGPYVSGMAAKAAIEFIERRFGLRRCRPREPDAETYRHCSNDIIANCSAPCVGKITAEQYRKRVEEACAFLRGERMELLYELREKMTQAAQEKRFEQAAALRDLLFHLHQVVKERARVRKSPKIKSTELKQGLLALKDRLKLSTIPSVIECFDISNISGTHSVASLVVAVDGVPTPNRYRRFRIKTVEGVDDPRSMAEVIRRRYTRLLKEKKNLPDLVMVDGGITQLRAAKAELNLLGLNSLPIVGLAKQYEQLVWDAEKNSGNMVLPPYSPELMIVIRLRDEAHRFAITYHRKLRQARIQESVLDEIPNIGKIKKEELLRFFGSITRLKKANLKTIQQVPGIGKKTALLIYNELHRGEEI